jgi:xylulokinase
VRIVDRTEPQLETASIYAHMYGQYRALYPALKPILSHPL